MVGTATLASSILTDVVIVKYRMEGHFSKSAQGGIQE